jgi:hypothetical protein
MQGCNKGRSRRHPLFPNVANKDKTIAQSLINSALLSSFNTLDSIDILIVHTARFWMSLCCHGLEKNQASMTRISPSLASDWHLWGNQYSTAVEATYTSK